MSALGGSPLDSSGGERGDRRVLRYLIPAGLVVLLVAMIVVIASSTGGSQGGSSSAGSRAADGGKLPLYWTVRRGQTYAQIAKKTGLSVAALKTLNPSTDPRSLVPGQRLKSAPGSVLAAPQGLGTSLLDGAQRPVVWLNRRQDRPKHRDPRAPQPTAESHHAAARRPGKTAPLSHPVAVSSHRQQLERIAGERPWSLFGLLTRWGLRLSLQVHAAP